MIGSNNNVSIEFDPFYYGANYSNWTTKSKEMETNLAMLFGWWQIPSTKTTRSNRKEYVFAFYVILFVRLIDRFEIFQVETRSDTSTACHWLIAVLALDSRCHLEYWFYCIGSFMLLIRTIFQWSRNKNAYSKMSRLYQLIKRMKQI